MATEAQKRLKARLESKAYRRELPPPRPLEPDPGAEDIYKKFVDSARTLSTPGKTNADGALTDAASFLSGSSPDLIERASQDAGVKTEDLLAQVERFRPGSINKFYLQKKDLSTSSEGGRPGKPDDTRGPSGAPPSRRNKGKGKTEIDFDSKPRPTVEDALGVMTGSGGIALGPGTREEVDSLKKVQRQYPTAENIAREAARQRPLDSWSRAEQYYEDLESTSDLLPFERKTKGAPLAEGESGPEEMPIPRATYAGKGTGRPVGPGGKAFGTQEDFNAWRAEKTVQDSLAAKRKAKREDFFRRGGRLGPDGKIAVLPGKAPETVTLKDGRKVKPSGAYAYADDLREEARLAENQRTKEKMERFIASNDDDRRADEYIKTFKLQKRAADQVARAAARGEIKLNDPQAFFAEYDVLRRTASDMTNDVDKQKEYALSRVRANQAVRDNYGRDVSTSEPTNKPDEEESLTDIAIRRLKKNHRG